MGGILFNGFVQILAGVPRPCLPLLPVCHPSNEPKGPPSKTPRQTCRCTHGPTDRHGHQTYAMFRSARSCQGTHCLPGPGQPAITELPVFSGLGCLLCPFTTCAQSMMEKHHRKAHPSGRRHGRPAACTASAGRSSRWFQTSCQRFFVAGTQSTYFRVKRAPQDDSARAPPPESRLVFDEASRTEQLVANITGRAAPKMI